MSHAPERKKVRIRENSWLAHLAAKKLGASQVALVVGHTIHLHNTSRADFLRQQCWVCHELKHVEQYEQLGITGFLWQYLRESLKNGYWNNRFEIEARQSENNSALLVRYDLTTKKKGC